MNCPQCRAKVPDKFSFCPRCGTNVRGGAPNPEALEANEPVPSDISPLYNPPRRFSAGKIVLAGLLAVGAVSGALLFFGGKKSGTTAPETSAAEIQEETKPETTKAPDTTKETTVTTTVTTTTEKETEATTPKTTTAAEKTTTSAAATTTAAPKTTAETKETKEKKKKNTAAPDKKDKSTKTTAKPAEQAAQQQPVQQEQPAQQEPAQPSTDPADYYASLGAMPFVCGNNGDPFLPPGIYTRADNLDGKALSEADAKRIMAELSVNWGDDADIDCGTVPDGNGTSDSTYRYITNAFPVPGLNDLQLPAAVDLYIHNGTTGSHLRAIDYRIGNHPDYTGPYIWSQDELRGKFNDLTAAADAHYGGHTSEGDSYNEWNDGALCIAFKEYNGKYYIWISRSND